ncbi:MAG: alpha/beta fold hydrolase [Myxococcales bacterium]|nr:alpha/beta fold hydrolase [Myxococcales bacterium]
MSGYQTALWVVAVGLAIWAMLWLHLRFWVRRLSVSLPYALEERLRTPDGAHIELRRLLPNEPSAGLPPVLVVHGVGANHRNNDLLADLSLARHLAERGRDVWLLTLRSGVAGRSLSETRRVRFGAMAHHDLPLAVAEVCERTHSEQVDYIGFSMGGMLLYAALGRTLPFERVRRVAIVGSPAVVRSPIPLRVPAFIGRLPEVLFPTLRLRLAARAGAFASEWVRTPAHHFVFNPTNVAKGVSRISLVNVIEDIPGPLNREFAAWAASATGEITLDGEPVLERLAGASAPAIFFAGSNDRLAPPAAVQRAFDAWGAETGVEKRWVLLGVAAGATADYGHGDLAVGARAVEEIFGPLADFLGHPGVAAERGQA